MKRNAKLTAVQQTQKATSWEWSKKTEGSGGKKGDSTLHIEWSRVWRGKWGYDKDISCKKKKGENESNEKLLETKKDTQWSHDPNVKYLVQIRTRNQWVSWR